MTYQHIKFTNDMHTHLWNVLYEADKLNCSILKVSFQSAGSVLNHLFVFNWQENSQNKCKYTNIRLVYT